MGMLSKTLIPTGQICPVGKLNCSCQLHLSCAALCVNTQTSRENLSRSKWIHLQIHYSCFPGKR